jgi:hypothetical protein
MMYDNAMDWIPITLRFRGKCIECGKELTSGQALWSKSTKSIKHIECAQGKAEQETSNSARESTIRGQEIKAKNKRYEETIIQKCFICNKWVVDEYTSFRYSNYVENKSHSYVCQSCIQDENAFENYRQSFLQKIKKLK